MTVIGFSLFLQSLTFAGGCVLAAIFYLSVTVSAEEATLRNRFGQEFVDYCQRVPRFWPRFRQLFSPQEVVVNTSGLWSEAYRAARWIWLPLLGELLLQCRSEAWFPQWFHMP